MTNPFPMPARVLRVSRAAFAPHLLQKDGSPYVKLEIWDTAGQEQFQSLAPMYYRGAEGAVLMFDLTSARSFEAMKHWGEELGANGRDGVALVVCGNKCDLVERDPDSREVESEFAIAYADEIGAEYFETSALTDVNVHEAFMRVTDEIMSLRRAQAGDAPLASADPRDRHESIVLPDEDARMGSKPRGGKGCCS